METRRGSVPDGMKARPGTPRRASLRRSIQVARLFYSLTAFFASENVWKISKERMENGKL